MLRLPVAFAAVLSAAGSPILAQCSDGSQPPCGPARLAVHTNSRASDRLAVARPSLAVLYLQHQDSADAIIADVLTEDIIAQLSQREGLSVLSRYTAMRYRSQLAPDPRAVGRETGVRYVMQGMLRRVGNDVRVVIEVTDASGGFNVWAQTFARQLADVIAMRDSIAIKLAEALSARLISVR